jgi:hypothetical protein
MLKGEIDERNGKKLGKKIRGAKREPFTAGLLGNARTAPSEYNLEKMNTSEFGVPMN